MIQLIATGPQDYLALQTAVHWRGQSLPPGGLEPPDILAMLVGWSQRLHDAQGWGTWVAVASNEVVCSLAIKDPPVQGAVEIGYGTAPQRRGQGHATAAVRALLTLLQAKSVTHVRAETAVANPASGRVLEKAGFARTGTRHDAEDGDLILWEYPALQA